MSSSRLFNCATDELTRLVILFNINEISQVSSPLALFTVSAETCVSSGICVLVNSGGKNPSHTGSWHFERKTKPLGEVVNPQNGDQKATACIAFYPGLQKNPCLHPFYNGEVRKQIKKKKKLLFRNVWIGQKVHSHFPIRSYRNKDYRYTGCFWDDTEKLCIPVTNFPHWLHFR